MTLLINHSLEQGILIESNGKNKISQNSIAQNSFQFWLACRNFKMHFNDRPLNTSYIIAKDIHKTYLKHYNQTSIKDFIEKIHRNIVKEKLKSFEDICNKPNQLKSIFDPLQGKIAQLLSHYLPNIITDNYTKPSKEIGKFKTTHVRLLAEKSPHEFANLLIGKLELISPEPTVTNKKCQFSLLTIVKNLQCHKKLSPTMNTRENIDPQEILDYHCKRVWPEEDYFINKTKFTYSHKVPSVDPWIIWPSYKNSENKSLEDSAFTSSCSSVLGC